MLSTIYRHGLKPPNMKRTIFFWLDKLKISRTERRAIITLLIILAGLMAVNVIIAPSAPFNSEYYNTLDEQFRKRTALMKQENETLLARYEGRKTTPDQANTLPQPDTAKAKADVQPSSPGTLIDINTADAKTLQKLNGIGAAYAKRIMVYRQKNGSLSSKEELLEIKGIGPARLNKITAFITLGDSGSTLDTSTADTIKREQDDLSRAVETESDEQLIININKADDAALQKLPGIGPAYAGRIVQYRQKNGPFTDTDELLKIKGIGKKRLANIKAFIKLTGQ